MFKLSIAPHWQISRQNGSRVDAEMLLALLVGIKETGAITQAAAAAGLSYRYAWGVLREAERLFGGPLLEKTRGRGTTLTPLAETLIWADRRIAARLSPILESLASELEGELDRIILGDRRALRLNASHGFAVAMLLNSLEEAGIPMELRYRNSTEAVAALSRKECDLAGFHVPLGHYQLPAAMHYATWLGREEHRLIHLTTRRQGFCVAPGNPKDVYTLEDLTRPDIRFVNRQNGSGTRMLVELMLGDIGITATDINGFESAEFTHAAVAAYIASGMADVGIGVETAAQRFGLDFIPLMEERYFLAAPTAAIDEPAMRQVLALIRSRAYRDGVHALPGYDSSETGRVLTVEEAFGPLPDRRASAKKKTDGGAVRSLGPRPVKSDPRI